MTLFVGFFKEGKTNIFGCVLFFKGTQFADVFKENPKDNTFSTAFVFETATSGAACIEVMKNHDGLDTC